MKGFIIAAGMGMRMGRLTEAVPKCLLPVGGRPLIEWTAERLRAAGCAELVVIVGYRKELVRPAGAQIVENRQYRDNNILHSLMSAREHLSGPVMVSYSDIWVEPEIHRQLAATPGDIVIAADTDWQPYYEGRTLHPLGEAENAYVDASGRALRFGKGLPAAPGAGLRCTEFLGLWRMSERGTARFCETFLELERRLDPDAPFQNAAAWRKAYITDHFQELTDLGQRIDSALIERGWAELDTPQDYERLRGIAARQRLHSLAGMPEEAQ